MKKQIVLLILIFSVTPIIFSKANNNTNLSYVKINQTNYPVTVIGTREILNGSQIENVTVHFECMYSQQYGSARIDFYFSNTSQINGSYQIEDQEDGRFVNFDKSYIKLGYPIDPNDSFKEHLITFPAVTKNRIYYDYYNKTITDHFKSNGFSKPAYFVGNVTGPIIQDGLTGDMGFSVCLYIELTNSTIIKTNTFGTAFGGFFSMDQGAAGPFIEVEFDLSDINQPEIESASVLPSNPTTDFDVVLIKFWSQDNTQIYKIYLRYEIDNENITVEMPSKEIILGSPFFFRLGQFPVGSIRVWIIIKDISAWATCTVMGPIVIDILKGPDVKPPEIFVTNQTFYKNELANLTWLCTDDNPDFVVIYTNGAKITETKWQNGYFEISINVLRLALGENNVTAIFYDKGGLSTTSTLIATLKTTPLDLFQVFLIIITSTIVLVPASLLTYKKFLTGQAVKALSYNNFILLYLTLRQVVDRYHKILKTGFEPEEMVEGEAQNLPEIIESNNAVLTNLRLKIEKLYDIPSTDLIEEIKKLDIDRLSDKGLKELIYLANRWPSLVSPTEIIEVLEIKRSTVYSVTNLLEEKELITKTTSLKDVRKSFIRITEKGLNLLEELTVQLELVLKEKGYI
ncbi:MAG: hypothetical protein ACTSW1_09915 [Candidatus Hodarchaeales archaeon]